VCGGADLSACILPDGKAHPTGPNVMWPCLTGSLGTSASALIMQLQVASGVVVAGSGAETGAAAA